MAKRLIEDFVLESNAIENICVVEGPEYNNHIALANFIHDEGESSVSHVQKIHSGLMKGLLEPNLVGNYRPYMVSVGGNPTPTPDRIPKLMEDFDRKLKAFLHVKCKGWCNENIEKGCWHYHHYFECIHPFVDGNGRTGRLLLNNLRLYLKLPWLTVKYAEREDYYKTIQNWRDIQFAKEIE